jgi:hypothetical protein
MNRREFLEILGLGGAGLLAIPSAFAATAIGNRVGEVAKLMFDSRYSLVRDHAHGLANEGISCIDTGGDLVGLWHRDPDAFRLATGQVMLGHTTWSDFQALRVLIDDVRLGRDDRIGSREDHNRFTVLEQNPTRGSCGELARYCSSRFNPQQSVHLVTWVASA